MAAYSKPVNAAHSSGSRRAGGTSPAENLPESGVGSPSRRLQEPLGWYLRTFRAASWGRLRAAEQRYPARSTATRSGSAALKAPRALPPAARVLTGPGRVKALRCAPPSRCAGLDPARTGQGSSAYEEALGVVRTRENTDPAGGSVLSVRESSATATPPRNRRRDCQPQRHGAGCAAAPVSVSCYPR